MYTNAKYYNTMVASPSGIIVDINGVQSTVPLDPANTDYQNIMVLVAAGELTIAPADEPSKPK
jgi:hypothetical protein